MCVLGRSGGMLALLSGSGYACVYMSPIATVITLEAEMMPSADRGADVQASRYILQQFCTSNSTRQGRDRLAAREPWKTGHASACICARHNHVGKCSTHPRLHLSELPIAAFQRGTYMHVWHHVRRPYLAFSAGGASHGAFAPQMQTQALADAMAVADDSSAHPGLPMPCFPGIPSNIRPFTMPWSSTFSWFMLT